MSLASVRPTFAPEDSQSSHKQALLQSSRAPQKVLNLGHINGDLCPVLDAGTLRINADSRTASGTTDSSHGAVVEEEEVQSSVTDPLQTTDKREGTSAIIKSQPRRNTVSQLAQGINESPPSGCGLLEIMFSCLHVKEGAVKAKPAPKGGGSRNGGVLSPHVHLQANKPAGHHSGSRSRSRERHGRHGQESRSSSKIGVSNLEQTQDARESLRNRFTESPVRGPSLPNCKRRFSEGHRHEKSTSVVSSVSTTSERQSQHSSHGLDAHLARERCPHLLIPSQPRGKTTTALHTRNEAGLWHSAMHRLCRFGDWWAAPGVARQCGTVQCMLSAAHAHEQD